MRYQKLVFDGILLCASFPKTAKLLIEWLKRIRPVDGCPSYTMPPSPLASWPRPVPKRLREHIRPMLSLRFLLHSKEVTASRERSESSLPSYTGLPGPKTRWKADNAYENVKQAQAYSLLKGIEAQTTVKWRFLGINDELWVAILPVCSTNAAHLPAYFQPTTHRIATLWPIYGIGRL